jgi:hypothetical protein
MSRVSDLDKDYRIGGWGRQLGEVASDSRGEKKDNAEAQRAEVARRRVGTADVVSEGWTAKAAMNRRIPRLGGFAAGEEFAELVDGGGGDGD